MMEEKYENRKRKGEGEEGKEDEEAASPHERSEALTAVSIRIAIGDCTASHPRR
jgi:hypothetical protein